VVIERAPDGRMGEGFSRSLRSVWQNVILNL
jgi:hypothetical protein